MLKETIINLIKDVAKLAIREKVEKITLSFLDEAEFYNLEERKELISQANDEETFVDARAKAKDA